jgi:hypothetical protein
MVYLKYRLAGKGSPEKMGPDLVAVLEGRLQEVASLLLDVNIIFMGEILLGKYKK